MDTTTHQGGTVILVIAGGQMVKFTDAEQALTYAVEQEEAGNPVRVEDDPGQVAFILASVRRFKTPGVREWAS
jgi:hypothetical protein